MLCRVCWKTAKLQIDMFSAVGLNLNIVQIVQKHLCLKPVIADISCIICNDCWLTVSSFHEFYESVEQAQSSFTQQIWTEAGTSNNVPIYELKQRDLAQDSVAFLTDEGEILNDVGSDNLFSDCELEENSFSLEMALKPNDNAQGIATKTSSLQTNKQVEEHTATNTENVAEHHDEVQSCNQILTNKANKITESATNGVKGSNVISEFKDLDAIIAKNMEVKCEICQEICATFRKLKDHMELKHQVKGYLRCCGKKFFIRHILVDHIESHNIPDYFKCHECGKVFTSRHGVRKHILCTHRKQPEKMYTCNQCGKRFAKEYILVHHQIDRHPETSTTCTICDESFSDKASLKRHVVDKHTSLPYMCEICAKLIRGLSNFKLHQEEHMGIKLPKLQCSKCGAWLKDKHSLRKHMSGHGDGKIYKCKTCGKELASHNALVRHNSNVHTTPKHECCICKKLYKRKAVLKEHMARHTGDVAYKCEFCPKTFSINSVYYCHRSKKHPKEYEALLLKRAQNPEQIDSNKDQIKLQPFFRCEFCQKTFRHKANYDTHLKKKHPKECE